MEAAKKYWQKVVQRIKLSNKKDFDDDFCEILQVYHFFNLYHPHRKREKQLAGIFTFALVTFSYLGGILMTICDAIRAGDIHLAMFLTSLAALFFAFSTQNLNMSLSQPRIIAMVRTLQSLHECDDEAEMTVVRKRCVKFLKWYKIALMSINMIFVCKLCGFSLCNLFLPTVYDKWAESGFSYWLLLFVNFVHIYLMSAIFYASESFHFLCIARIEANLTLLGKKLRICGNGSKEDNEKQLISLIKYHLAIIG